MVAVGWPCVQWQLRNNTLHLLHQHHTSVSLLAAFLPQQQLSKCIKYATHLISKQVFFQYCVFPFKWALCIKNMRLQKTHWTFFNFHLTCSVIVLYSEIVFFPENVLFKAGFWSFSVIFGTFLMGGAYSSSRANVKRGLNGAKHIHKPRMQGLRSTSTTMHVVHLARHPDHWSDASFPDELKV